MAAGEIYGYRWQVGYGYVPLAYGYAYGNPRAKFNPAMPYTKSTTTLQRLIDVKGSSSSLSPADKDKRPPEHTGACFEAFSKTDSCFSIFASEDSCFFLDMYSNSDPNHPRNPPDIPVPGTIDWPNDLPGGFYGRCCLGIEFCGSFLYIIEYQFTFSVTGTDPDYYMIETGTNKYYLHKYTYQTATGTKKGVLNLVYLDSTREITADLDLHYADWFPSLDDFGNMSHRGMIADSPGFASPYYFDVMVANGNDRAQDLYYYAPSDLRFLASKVIPGNETKYYIERGFGVKHREDDLGEYRQISLEDYRSSEPNPLSGQTDDPYWKLILRSYNRSTDGVDNQTSLPGGYYVDNDSGVTGLSTRTVMYSDYNLPDGTNYFYGLLYSYSNGYFYLTDVPIADNTFMDCIVHEDDLKFEVQQHNSRTDQTAYMMVVYPGFFVNVPFGAESYGAVMKASDKYIMIMTGGDVSKDASLWAMRRSDYPTGSLTKVYADPNPGVEDARRHLMDFTARGDYALLAFSNDNRPGSYEVDVGIIQLDIESLLP